MSCLASSLFSSPALIFTAAIALRAILLLYGIYQDAHSAFKYTDIDYYVFTDAARALAWHPSHSPYVRATYRYTPLLAWTLLPTTWGGWWFHFGKALFAASDVVAGWLIWKVLERRGVSGKRGLKYASVWLLNPMVANISTRGSSEGLLCVLVVVLLWAFESRRIAFAGVMLGLSVHFKIYPFIYGASMLWVLESPTATAPTLMERVTGFWNKRRATFMMTSLATFMGLNIAMYTLYGPEFLEYTFAYHLRRLDHRHNFSPYNALLYITSAKKSPTTFKSSSFSSRLSPASLAFVPQLLLSTVIIPLATAKLDLPTTMLAQTLAFVAFNKVVTSQYFLWYLVFLPLYLPDSALLRNKKLGLGVLAAWVLGQAAWLQRGYELEFLGRSTWTGLWGSSLGFFGINCWILGEVVRDVLSRSSGGVENESKEKVIVEEVKAGRDIGKEREERIPIIPAAKTDGLRQEFAVKARKRKT